MIYVNKKPIAIKQFPDGTPRLHLSPVENEVEIEWMYSPNEEMILYYVVCHLRENFKITKLNLCMPYIPNARMDRVKNSSEVFTLKHFCDFINSLKFDKVIVRDAHSYVSLALLDHVEQEDVFAVINSLAKKLLCNGDIVFFPDEGSYKRYSGNVEFPCAFGIKNRDWSTGEILGLEVMGEIPQIPFQALIVDDISSYGGTFLHAAKKLKELGAVEIYLYVTHCENSVLQGDMINSGLIQGIYTTKSIYSGEHPKIKVIGD